MAKRLFNIFTKNPETGKFEIKQVDGRPYTIEGVKGFIQNDYGIFIFTDLETGYKFGDGEYNFNELIQWCRQRILNGKYKTGIEKAKKEIIDAGFTLPLNK